MTKIKARKLHTFSEKCIGLMGKSKPENIYFETRWGIHTFFMKFPIDVIVLDREGRVTVLFVNLKPWRIAFWNPKYERVLELKAGTVQAFSLKIGTAVTVTS